MGDLLVDTNVVLRHLMQDNAAQSPSASAFFAAVERGEQVARLSETIVFETVFTLERTYRVPRALIRDAVLPLMRLPDVILPGKEILDTVFDLYTSMNKLSFADCYHAVLVSWLKLDGIASFDRGLDRVPGLRRVEP